MGAFHSRGVERGWGGRGASKQLTLASSFSSSRTTTFAKLHSSRPLSASKWRCFLSMIHLQVNTCCTSATVAGQHLLQINTCCPSATVCRSTFAAGQHLLHISNCCRSMFAAGQQLTADQQCFRSVVIAAAQLNACFFV